MPEALREIFIGITPADAERVKLTYDSGGLRLSYVDWQENSKEFLFVDVLGFRWQEFDLADNTDDRTYIVLDSEWLRVQAKLQAVRPEEFSHYKICFNSCGMLDVLARSVPRQG